MKLLIQIFLLLSLTVFLFFALVSTHMFISMTLDQIDSPDAVLTASQVYKARDFSVTFTLQGNSPEVSIHARVGKNVWLEDGIATSAITYLTKTEIRSGLWIQYIAPTRELRVWTAYYGPENPNSHALPITIK